MPRGFAALFAPLRESEHSIPFELYGIFYGCLRRRDCFPAAFVFYGKR
jgi:hypothetical protein